MIFTQVVKLCQEHIPVGPSITSTSHSSTTQSQAAETLNSSATASALNSLNPPAGFVQSPTQKHTPEETGYVDNILEDSRLHLSRWTSDVVAGRSNDLDRVGYVNNMALNRTAKELCRMQVACNWTTGNTQQIHFQLKPNPQS